MLLFELIFIVIMQAIFLGFKVLRIIFERTKLFLVKNLCPQQILVDKLLLVDRKIMSIMLVLSPNYCEKYCGGRITLIFVEPKLL